MTTSGRPSPLTSSSRTPLSSPGLLPTCTTKGTPIAAMLLVQPGSWVKEPAPLPRYTALPLSTRSTKLSPFTSMNRTPKSWPSEPLSGRGNEPELAVGQPRVRV